MHLFSKYRRQGSGTYFQNTGFLTASAKLAVKYWPGWWNTGHLATPTLSVSFLALNHHLKRVRCSLANSFNLLFCYWRHAQPYKTFVH